MDKVSIRKEVLQSLKDLTSSQRARWSQQLTERLLASEAYQGTKSLGTYLSMPHEFDTSYLIEQAQKDGKQIFIPKTYSQPVDKSVVKLIHVPGLAWNQAGFRVGYGGGFYNRYLVDYQGETVSTLADFQIYDFEPDVFDIPVKELLIFEELF